MYLSATGGAPGRSWPGESCRQRYGAGLKPIAKAGDQLWEEHGAGRAAGCSGEQGEAAKSSVQMGTARAISCAVDRLIPSPVTATLSLFDTDLPFFTLSS